MHAYMHGAPTHPPTHPPNPLRCCVQAVTSLADHLGVRPEWLQQRLDALRPAAPRTDDGVW